VANPISAPVKIQIKGNVDGNIVVGDNNFVVNTNHGTIVYRAARPQVRRRDFTPQPPRARRGFINRLAELQKIESWISSGEGVVIHGPDGMGKSALLRQAANGQAARSMPGGVVFLEGVSQTLGAEDIIQRLFDALFESDPPLKVDANSARTYLSNTRPLVLLDEVPLTGPLLQALPDIFSNGALLVVSDLAMGGDDFLHMPVGPLPRDAALRILAEKSGVELNPVNRANLETICALLEDISLAVVITGNVMREAGVSLDDTRMHLQALDRNAGVIAREHQQETVRGLDRAFSFAAGRLKPEERQVLSIAAHTPGPSMAPEWLLAAFGSDAAIQVIERLKALGLLEANSPRLRLPPGIQIQARRAAILDVNTVLQRLAGYLLDTAEREPQNWDFFNDEIGNLSGLLTWAVQTRDWHLAVRLARVLDPFLTLHGLWDAWREVLDFFLEAARQSGDRPMEALALHQSGVSEIGAGARTKALDHLRQALEIRRGLRDAAGMAYTQHNIDFLLGPPAPSQGNGPGPGSPPRVPAGAILAGLVGLSVIAAGILLLLGIFLFRQPAAPGPLVPSSTAMPLESTATLAATLAPTTALTPTLPPTDTATPVIPAVEIKLTDSAVLDRAFLYQGLDTDYFEVPVLINIHNVGAADIPDFNLTVFYETADGRHQTMFRYEGQRSYSDSQAEKAISSGQMVQREVRLIVPRTYEHTEIRLLAEADVCQQEVLCTLGSLSYALPEIVFDFIDTAQSANWLGYDTPSEQIYHLTFNGQEVKTGFVRLEQGLTLEDRFRPFYALYTHPTWVDNGWISGVFDLSEIKFSDEDRIIVKVGYVDGAGGDGVTFRLGCNTPIGTNPVHPVTFRSQPDLSGDILSIYDKYDRILPAEAAPVPADAISGSCREFYMRVEAGPTSDSDWAVWLSAYIERP